MADKICVGCDYKGNETNWFKLTTKEDGEELYCAECMGAVFENEPECVVKVEAI